MQYFVFGKSGCNFCDRTVQLLESIGAQYSYIDIDKDPSAKYFIQSAGHTTVPQIYYSDESHVRKHLGGYDTLTASLEKPQEEVEFPEEVEEILEETLTLEVDPVAVNRVLDKMPIPTKCDVCESPQVVLVNNKVLYGKSYGDWPYMYHCVACTASVGVHKHTDIPLGTLADAPTRKARREAKDLFNPVWITKGMKRTQAYQWLADQMQIPKEQCHFGMFTEKQCKEAIEHIEKWSE